MESNPITLKISSMTKNKRIGQLPKTFSELRAVIENQIKDERPVFKHPDAAALASSDRDFLVRYNDGDEEIINISDDEDLQTAYEVAAKELKGRLNIKVDFKMPIQVPPEYFSHASMSHAGLPQNLSSYRGGSCLDDSISMSHRSSILPVPRLNIGSSLVGNPAPT